MQKDTIEEYMDIHPKLRAKYEKMIKKHGRESTERTEAKEKAEKGKSSDEEKATSKKKMIGAAPLTSRTGLCRDT